MIDMRKYEKAAMILLSSDERDRLGTRVEALAESFHTIESIDTSEVQPMISVIDSRNIFRDDVSMKTIARDELMSNAPEHYDGYFRVPGTLD